MKKSLPFLFSAFISGAAVMTVEMSGTRLLAPYFGNSLFVWTNIIGLIIVALALGYYLGGQIADKKPNPFLYFLFFFITGLWIALIPFFAAPIFKILFSSFSNLAHVVRIGSFLAVLILFVVPMIFLGMVIPFTVKLIATHMKELGRVSGKVSMISTVGSLAGTFLPAFLFIPVLGTTKTFILTGVLLMVLGAIGIRKLFFTLISALSLILFWLAPPVYAHEEILYSKDSPYGFIFITEDEKGIRRLHVNNPIGTQSIYDPENVLLSDRFYYSYFGVLPAMVEEAQTVLILGHAGGTFTRIFNGYYPELEITGVEIDPLITAISKEYMGLGEATVEIVHADARGYLLMNEENYDLILVDTYQSSTIPPHLATQEFFALAASHLNAHGILALNAAAEESEFLEVLSNSMARPFSHSALLKIPDSYNSMLLASLDQDFRFVSKLPQDLESKGGYLQANLHQFFYDPHEAVFTDEKSTQVEILSDKMHFEILRNY